MTIYSTVAKWLSKSGGSGDDRKNVRPPLKIVPRDKRSVLKALEFGCYIAEDEATELEDYFLGTPIWASLEKGEIDIVLGAKGSGKSALATRLCLKDSADPTVSVIFGENPTGEAVFQSVANDPPSSEQEFRVLWLLYFLTIAGKFIRDDDKVANSDMRTVLVRALEDARLLKPGGSIGSLLNDVRRHIRNVLSNAIPQIDAGLEPGAGLPTLSFSLHLPGDPDGVEHTVGLNELLKTANEALEASDLSLWVVLDRLDAAFGPKPEIESMAIRALLRAYRDLSIHDRLKPKIFLRSDIWDLINSSFGVHNRN